MRHYFMRMALGVIWLLGAVVGFISGSILSAVFGLVMSAVFFSSAHSIRKKDGK